MKKEKYLFTISWIYRTEVTVGEISKNKLLEAETLKDAWKNIFDDELDTHGATNLQSLSIRYLGELDE